MTDREALEKWMCLVSKTGSNWRNADDLKYFLLNFSPKGAGLDEALRDMEGGEKVCARIIPLYGKMYDKLAPVPTASELKRLVQTHLEIALKIARATGSILERFSPKDIFYRIEHGSSPDRITVDLEQELYESMTSYFDDVSHCDSPIVRLLHEAVFTLCGDFLVRNHVIWPLVDDPAIVVTEPYLPYFELWMANVSIRFQNEAEVVIFAPSK
jgi:hypothetical protein